MKYKISEILTGYENEKEIYGYISDKLTVILDEIEVDPAQHIYENKTFSAFAGLLISILWGTDSIENEFYRDIAEKIPEDTPIPSKSGLEHILMRSRLSDQENLFEHYLKEAGANGEDYGKIKNAGYFAFYQNSLSTVKSIKGLKKSHNLYDYLSSEELSAHWLRLKRTNDNIKNKQIDDLTAIEKEFVKSSDQTREAVVFNMAKYPEEISSTVSIDKLKGKVKKVRHPLPFSF